MAPRRVVVIGSCNEDLVLVVRRLPPRGATVGAVAMSRAPGGKGANQAAAAAAAGAPTSFIGRVGLDPAGDRGLDALREVGVEVELVSRSPGAETGVAVVLVSHAGDNLIATYAGANAEVSPALAIHALSAVELNSDDVVLTGYEVPAATVLAVARAAHHAGARAVVNCAPADADLTRQIAPLGPLVVVNEDECREISGLPDPREGLVRLHEWTRAPAIVTLGARGALLVDVCDAPISFAAPRVDARDTSGAGDVFVGVLAASMCLGRSLPDALPLALSAASQSVQYEGARIPPDLLDSIRTAISCEAEDIG